VKAWLRRVAATCLAAGHTGPACAGEPPQGVRRLSWPTDIRDRAEDNAAKSDPDVTSILPCGAWQVAHNIPVQMIKDNLGVFGPASRAADGFQTDEPGNMPALPKTPDAQKILADKKIIRPTHSGPHDKYSKEVQEDVDQIKLKLREERLVPGMDRYAQRANELIRELETRLRDGLPVRPSMK
jgi:hypothetical protein